MRKKRLKTRQRWSFSLQGLWSFSRLLLTAVFLLSASSGFAEKAVPSLVGPVVDQAHILSKAEKRDIEHVLYTLEKQQGTQIAVLTIDSLEGESIESFSIRVVDEWQLGSKEEDNGILLLVAMADRKIRIEVGQGKEGDLPDAYGKRIIDQVISPSFKSGNYAQGILLGLQEIIKKTDPTFDINAFIASEELSQPRTKQGIKRFSEIFVLLIVILAVFLSVIARALGISSGRHSWQGQSGGFRHYGGHSRGGGGFSGGSGGGGFSGGGGGFSGGGASGGW